MKLPNLFKLILVMVVLTILECGLVGYIAYWREPFWDAVNTLNITKFIWYIGYFTIAALSACIISSYNQYIQSYTALIFRYRLSRKALKFKPDLVEGQSQRIQEDCLSYPMLLINLSVGLFRNVSLLSVFIFILVSKLGLFYLILPIIYATIGTLLAAKLAKPLINLNYVNQVLEAKFRQILTKLNYAKVHKNNVILFKTTKHLAYFQYFYNQITVIIPYIILAPLYFSLKMTFGVFMQCASVMNSVIDCLSYFINSFNDINKLLSCRKRLKELEVI